jgi:hypothetical protein
VLANAKPVNRTKTSSSYCGVEFVPTTLHESLAALLNIPGSNQAQEQGTGTPNVTQTHQVQQPSAVRGCLKANLKFGVAQPTPK